jgi:hypothetical protein|tara:strand:+ start:26 stop:217 length:192 start_codon:yes stop_codon:yes gene_type:complete
MPIVRVDETGKTMKKYHRKVGVASAALVLAGLAVFFGHDAMTGLAVMVLGNSLAAVWNLSDDS